MQMDRYRNTYRSVCVPGLGHIHALHAPWRHLLRWPRKSDMQWALLMLRSWVLMPFPIKGARDSWRNSRLQVWLNEQTR